ALPAAVAPTQTFADALEDRVHRLFGQAAQRWDITPGFTAFTRAAFRNGIEDPSHGLSPVLQSARRNCMQELLAR
ncbi:MAG: HDOD domain-containing protein, partial [Rhodoferax sp.]|nr:HDOD domain-containing protein [Rhodoferax sp.]